MEKILHQFLSDKKIKKNYDWRPQDFLSPKKKTTKKFVLKYFGAEIAPHKGTEIGNFTTDMNGIFTLGSAAAFTQALPRHSLCRFYNSS